MKKPAARPATKAVAKKGPAGAAAAKKPVAKKAAATRATPAKKAVSKKTAPKTATVSKAAPKKAVTKAAPAKKAGSTPASAIKRVAESLVRLVKPKAAATKTAPARTSKAGTGGKAAAKPASRASGQTRKATAAPAKKAVPARSAEQTPARKTMTHAAPQSAKARTPKTLPPVADSGAAILPDRPDLPMGYRPKPGEEYMSPEQLEYFRQKLMKWRADLVEESQQTIDNLREEVRDVGDDAERATRETENSLELRTRDRYRKLISKIDKALKRIEEGDYGYCEETGEEIGLERLEARPIATLSFDAQERWEHRQKLMGD